MNTMIQIKNAILAALSAIGGWLISAFGGWDVTLQTLIAFMVVDYITGLIVAGVFHKSKKTESGALESRAGFKGLVRKCAMLALIFLAVMLDGAAGTGFVRPAVCLFFTANEGLSLLENLGLMGAPYPEFLKNMLEVLKKQGNSGGKEEDHAGKGR